MESNKNGITGLLNEMEKLGVPMDKAKLEAMYDEAVKKEEVGVFDYRGPQTSREAKVYRTVEKTLDKAFSAYGKVKDKAIPATVNTTKAAVVKSRSWLGNMIKQLGEKIEPKS